MVIINFIRVHVLKARRKLKRELQSVTEKRVNKIRVRLLKVLRDQHDESNYNASANPNTEFTI